MKRTIALLTLALAVSGSAVVAQTQGEQAGKLKESAKPQEQAGPERKALRKEQARQERWQRREAAGPRQWDRAPAGRGAQRGQFAPRRQDVGPGPRLTPPGRGQGPFAPLGRGPAWNPRRFGQDTAQARPQFCPRCGCPFGPIGGPGRPGFWARRGADDMSPPSAPQGRRPAFGPPPWAQGRGAPERGIGPRPGRPDAPGVRRQGRGFRGPPNVTPRPDDEPDDR